MKIRKVQHEVEREIVMRIMKFLRKDIKRKKGKHSMTVSHKLEQEIGAKDFFETKSKPGNQTRVLR